ncbi:ArsA family ATPase [Leekyejoonella antrihumi]|uniref:ArsA HSP20-like domain-containing protein n=1 Tax=Leekyejoonella antrihumi TaxID=1660198 RepID=A0A563E423_9MICO|nr:hypothetical protein [Leekyejoonella antrihumi]TWP36982.1 hypothetical protein FGL98_07960 [Leekyejoonella antrihumi]
MLPRLVLVGGAGGAGASTCAAGIAAAYAADGRRVSLATLDGCAGAGDLVSEATVSRLGAGAPRPDLSAARGAMDLAGLDPRLIDELGGLPGRELVGVLWALADAPEHDLVVIDAGARVVDLVQLAGMLPWFVQGVLPAQRGWLTATRPLLAAAVGRRWPGPDTADALRAVYEATVRARDRLLGGTTATVLVMGDDASARAKTRWLARGLSLHDAYPRVVARRQGSTFGVSPVLPDVPVWDLPATADDTVQCGVSGLPDLTAPPDRARDIRADGQDMLWRMALPLIDSQNLRLTQEGDDLVLEAHGHRRLVGLPTALRRCRPAGALLRHGILEVRFRPTQQEQAT